MGQKVYTGLIWLKEPPSRVVAVDETGDKITSPFSISNCKEGAEKLASKLYSYKKSDIICAMEVSSNYWGTCIHTLMKRTYHASF